MKGGPGRWGRDCRSRQVLAFLSSQAHRSPCQRLDGEACLQATHKSGGIAK
jgi:hypothetical protein